MEIRDVDLAVGREASERLAWRGHCWADPDGSKQFRHQRTGLSSRPNLTHSCLHKYNFLFILGILKHHNFLYNRSRSHIQYWCTEAIFRISRTALSALSIPATRIRPSHRNRRLPFYYEKKKQPRSRFNGFLVGRYTEFCTRSAYHGGSPEASDVVSKSRHSKCNKTVSLIECSSIYLDLERI